MIICCRCPVMEYLDKCDQTSDEGINHWDSSTIRHPNSLLLPTPLTYTIVSVLTSPFNTPAESVGRAIIWQNNATLRYSLWGSSFNRSALNGCSSRVSHWWVEASSVSTAGWSKLGCHGHIRIYGTLFPVILNLSDGAISMGARPTAWIWWTWIAVLVSTQVTVIALMRWMIQGRMSLKLADLASGRLESASCILRADLKKKNWRIPPVESGVVKSGRDKGRVWYGVMVAGKQLWNTDDCPTQSRIDVSPDFEITSASRRPRAFSADSPYTPRF